VKDYYYLSVTQLIELIKSREVSVKEILSSHFERIDSLEDKVGAWAFLSKDIAFKQASDIDRQLSNGTFKGKLYGVPVGIKDIFNTCDMPTAMGSLQWEGFTPGNDARCVHYLRMNGAVFPGKTVTAEFAVHAPGKTVNPHNYEYSPGTSSSGSAAAVACFMLPLATGTQTAGSIIRPASYCGVYGFKPSFGLIPRTGVLKTVDTLDTVGMFARSPADLKLIFEVMRVHGKNFPISHAKLNDEARQKKGSRPWKVALIPSLTKKFSQPYAYEALSHFIDELGKNRDIELLRMDLRDEFNQAHRIHDTIYNKCLSYYFKREFSHVKFISKIIYELISNGNKITLDEYLAALEKQKNLWKHLDDFFNNCDIILTLSTQGIAPKLTEDDKPDTCLIWTLCGVPVINIPAFKGPQNMPFGLQIVSRRYNDYLLLSFAEFLAAHLERMEEEKKCSVRES
jgi:Asp-tRNA(Asn)/Glu-tRNA(Gln) amidotransferase A subunit family amidase